MRIRVTSLELRFIQSPNQSVDDLEVVEGSVAELGCLHNSDWNAQRLLVVRNRVGSCIRLLLFGWSMLLKVLVGIGATMIIGRH